LRRKEVATLKQASIYRWIWLWRSKQAMQREEKEEIYYLLAGLDSSVGKETSETKNLDLLLLPSDSRELLVEIKMYYPVGREKMHHAGRDRRR
jgi:hypothetical protein